jgi:hypothetical protein
LLLRWLASSTSRAAALTLPALHARDRVPCCLSARCWGLLALLLLLFAASGMPGGLGALLGVLLLLLATPLAEKALRLSCVFG